MNLATRAAARLGLITRADTNDGGPLPGVIPPRRDSDGSRVVTTREAATLDSVFRALQIIGTAVKQVSVGVWRDDVEISPEPAIVRKPDIDKTFREFIEETTMALAGTGNAFWKITRPGPGSPAINATLLPTRECSVSEDPKSGLRYVHWQGQTLRPGEYHHLKYMRLEGELMGLGPIQAAQLGLYGQLKMNKAVGGFFDESGIPNGVFTTDKTLSPAQAAQWKQAILDKVRPSEPAILGDGLKYQALGLRPADLQFLENQKFSVTQIARLFGIPAAYMLAAVDGTSDTYQNQEQADIAWVRYTLMNYFAEIEDAFTAILPRGQQARFKLATLLRTDTKTRYEAHEIAIRIGLYTPEYAQGIEGFPIHTITTAQKEEPSDA